MPLSAGSLIPDALGENRWEVVGPGHAGQPGTRTWIVRDRKADLDRRLMLIHPDYSDLASGDVRWFVDDRRAAFGEMARGLAPNFFFFPEPVDLLEFQNDDPRLPIALQAGEPALVYHLPPGVRIEPYRGQRNFVERELRRLALDGAYILRNLHKNRIVLRQLPLMGLRDNPVTGRPFVVAFETVIAQGRFQGHSTHDGGLHPNPAYAAPECFGPTGPLTPACDVYALGLTLLEFLGLRPRDGAGNLGEWAATELARRGLSEPYQRLFRLALAHRPDDRFADCGELIRFLQSGGDLEAARARGASTSARRSRSSSRRTQGKRRNRSRSQRPSGPPCAVVAWTDMRLAADTQFDYGRLMREFGQDRRLDPHIAFVRERTDMDNSFHKFLQSLGFELVPWRAGGGLGERVGDELATRLAGVERVVVVADPAGWGADALLDNRSLQSLDALLVHFGGPRPAWPTRIVDAQEFVRPMRRRGGRGGQRPHKHRQPPRRPAGPGRVAPRKDP